MSVIISRSAESSPLGAGERSTRKGKKTRRIICNPEMLNTTRSSDEIRVEPLILQIYIPQSTPKSRASKVF